MNNRGVALLALGQTEAARADFERALRDIAVAHRGQGESGETAAKASVRSTVREDCLTLRRRVR